MNISMIKIPLKQLLPYELSSTSTLLYGILLFYAYKDDCRTTNKNLASQLNVSDRTVQNCLKELKDKKVIEIEFERLPNNVEIRHIKPLVLFDVVLVPNSEIDKNAGFEVL